VLGVWWWGAYCRLKKMRAHVKRFYGFNASSVEGPQFFALSAGHPDGGWASVPELYRTIYLPSEAHDDDIGHGGVEKEAPGTFFCFFPLIRAKRERFKVIF